MQSIMICVHMKLNSSEREREELENQGRRDFGGELDWSMAAADKPGTNREGRVAPATSSTGAKPQKTYSKN